MGCNGSYVEALGFGDGLGLEDVGDYDFVGDGKALREFVLEYVAAKSVGARFKDGPQPPAGITRAQRTQGGGNRGGMMSEVVNQGDAVDFSFHFETTFHALKAFQRASDCIRRDTAICREGGGGACVPDVVFAGEGKLQFRPQLPVAHERPTRAGWLKFQVGDAPRGFSDCSVAFYRAEGASQAAVDALTLVESNDASAAGDKVHQAFASGLDSFEVFVNVGVVEFQRGEADKVCKILDQRAPLLE